MRNKLFGISLLLLGLLLISAGNNVAGEGDHHHVDDTTLCDEATQYLTITGYTDADGHFFDQKEYHVERGGCLQITFKNQSFLEHDMNIDEVQGENGIGAIHIHLESNVAGPNGDGVDNMNVTIPDADTEFDIFCTIPGHQDAGMQAKLIVGEGASDNESSLPGFGFIIAIGSIALLVIIPKIKRK